MSKIWPLSNQSQSPYCVHLTRPYRSACTALLVVYSSALTVLLNQWGALVRCLIPLTPGTHPHSTPSLQAHTLTPGTHPYSTPSLHTLTPGTHSHSTLSLLTHSRPLNTNWMTLSKILTKLYHKELRGSMKSTTLKKQ